MSGVSRVSCPPRFMTGAGSRITAEHGSSFCSCESMRGEIARNPPLPLAGAWAVKRGSFGKLGLMQSPSRPRAARTGRYPVVILVSAAYSTWSSHSDVANATTF